VLADGGREQRIEPEGLVEEGRDAAREVGHGGQSSPLP
jgi:hypothetical protein